jgi:D-cysteine desulfhydrase
MRLSRFPRRRYGRTPTPLHPLDRLTSVLGGPRIYIKRDDLLELTSGGNKTRKLEFLVADALAKGADTLVTTGAIQSNHCRLTLAAAIREGLRCRLVLEERIPGTYDPDASGNNFLYRLLGAERIQVVEGGTDVDAAMEGVVQELAGEGRVGYAIPGGGSNALGALGYVVCAEEIAQQALDQGLAIDHIVVASGSAGTHAGLLAGLLATRRQIPVTGISVNRTRQEQEPKVRELTREVLDFLGLDVDIPEDAVVVEDGYVGPGYSLPTEEMAEAVRTLARTEAILVDPVYTGKAMAGLMGLVEEGRFDPAENVLFIHTGGGPALFTDPSMVLE